MTSKRISKSPPFMLNDRDYQILSDIGKCGGLTAQQIGIQHFNPTVIRVYHPDGSVQGLEIMIHANCQKRLKLLLDNNFTRRVELYQRLKEGKKPYFYTLTRKGAQAVAAFLQCAIEETGWRERETRFRANYIHHHIKINDIRLALMRSLRESEDITLVHWYDEVELTKLHSEFTVPVNLGNSTVEGKLFPDACFVLRGADGKLRYHFVEADTGTETTESNNDLYRTFATKMRRYKHFLLDEVVQAPKESGKVGFVSRFEERYGVKRARVLTVTASQARRKRLLEVTERVGAQRLFWFSTHPQLITPSIVPYVRKTKKNGEEVELEAFQALMPDFLSEPMWLIAKDSDTTRPEHSLDEPFVRLVAH